MIFKKPGEAVINSHHNWSPQFPFSLSFHLSQQSHYSQLSRVSDPALTSIAERLPTLRAAAPVQNGDSQTLPLAGKVHREWREIFNTTEKKLRVFLDRNGAGETGSMAPLAVNSAAFLSAERSLVAPPAGGRADRLSDEGPLWTETSRPTLRPYFDHLEATKALKPDVEAPLIGLGNNFNAFVMAVTSSSGPLVDGRHSVELNQDEDELPAPALNRKLVEIALSKSEPAGDSQAQKYPGGDERAAPNYVFARTIRPSAAEEQVIKQVEEREIVEIVRKEVRTMMSPGAVIQNLSRADYTRIADQVYSDLARRLMAEKERVGLR
jgi:hypothetical protein